MGDFNDGPGSPAHAVLAGRDSNLADSWELLKRPENKQSFTSHGFTGIPEKNRIDWILLTSQWTVKDARIVQEPFENRYPSDHFPYYVDLAWKNENSTGSVIENSGEERGSNPASR
jgi:endonuclease/exonuclease/phosphatase family metal-dependent hydrolase